MKRLDWFSRLENTVSIGLGVLIVFGLPIVIASLVDKIFLEDFEWFVRLPVSIVTLVISFIVSIALGLGASGTVGGAFKLIRKIFGKKPLKQVEAELKDEIDEQEYRAEERAEKRFMDLSLDRKLYRLWLKQNKQFEFLKTKVERLENLLLFAP